jgi:hypothetical protein
MQKRYRVFAAGRILFFLWLDFRRFDLHTRIAAHADKGRQT